MGEPNQIEPSSRARRFAGKRRGGAETSIVELADSYEILEPEQGMDLRACGRIIRKRLFTILTVFLVVFVVTAIAMLRQKPTYRAQAVLEIQKENPDIPTILHEVLHHPGGARRPEPEAAQGPQGFLTHPSPARAQEVREGGNRLCFVRDPDGYRIEILERPAS